MLIRLWRRSLIARLGASLSWALRGARVHPTASLLARRGGLRLASGVKVSDGVVLECLLGGHIELEEAVWLAHHTEIQTDGLVHIGRGTTVQRYSSINGNVHIGCSCIIAPSVFISSGTHPFREIPHLAIRMQELEAAADNLDQPVVVHDDCWLGVHAVISPGVTLGKGVVVGANSVVTRDWPPYSVVAGAPARALKPRLTWSPPYVLDAETAEHSPYLYSGFVLRRRGDALVVEAFGGSRVEIAVPWHAQSVDVYLETNAALILNVDGERPFCMSTGANVFRIGALRPVFESDAQHRFRLAAFEVSGDPKFSLRILRTLASETA